VGKVIYRTKVSMAQNLMGIHEPEQKELDIVMALLPGASIPVGITPGSFEPISLDRKFIVEFENDVLEDGTEIEIDWVLHATADAGGYYKQFKIPSTIRLKGAVATGASVVTFHNGTVSVSGVIPNGTQVNIPGGGALTLGELPRYSADSDCQHDWVTYTGLTKVVRYCRLCNAEEK
jgi:hypothetical protein